jgi:hypothetical protein
VDGDDEQPGPEEEVVTGRIRGPGGQPRHDRAEAEVEAHCRLVVRDASRAIAARAAEGLVLKGARKVQVLGEDGKVLFEADLR